MNKQIITAALCASLSTTLFPLSPVTASPLRTGPFGQVSAWKASAKLSNGLETTVFQTGSGKITVHSTETKVAGDTLSGRVIVEPEGKNESEKNRNRDELNGHVIELEGQKNRVSDGKFAATLPPAMAVVSAFVLKDKSGKELGRSNFVTAAPPEEIEEYLPVIGQQGHPMEAITPPFDLNGDLKDTDVTVGGKPLEILAESPREVVARNTSGHVGPSTLEVKEKANTVKGDFRSVKLDLSAPKLNLLRGEKTTVNVTITGLEGLRTDTTFDLVNRSPDIVGLAEGNEQTFKITPEQQKEGKYVVERSLTGVKPGSFTIVALVRTKKRPRNKDGGGKVRKPGERPPDKAPDSKKNIRDKLAEMNQLITSAREKAAENQDGAINDIQRARLQKEHVFDEQPFQRERVLGMSVRSWARFVHRVDENIQLALYFLQRGNGGDIDIARSDVADAKAEKEAFEHALGENAVDGDADQQRLSAQLGAMNSWLSEAADAIAKGEIEKAKKLLGDVERLKHLTYVRGPGGQGDDPFTGKSVFGIPVFGWLDFVDKFDRELISAENALRDGKKEEADAHLRQAHGFKSTVEQSLGR